MKNSVYTSLNFNNNNDKNLKSRYKYLYHQDKFDTNYKILK
jgi:hypothetical protein